MNAKQKKLLLILLGILVVLVAALLLTRLISKQAAAKKTAADSASESAITDKGEAYHSLVYSNGTATLSFESDDSGNWHWTDDPDFPLDQSDVNMLVNLISGMTPLQTITKGDTMEAYGLDHPAVTLTATTSDGTKTVFDLGNQTADGEGNYYMLMNGDTSQVYVVSNTLHDQLVRGIYDMMQLPTFPKLTEDNLLAVNIQGAVSSALVPTKTADGSSTKVSWNCNGTDVTGKTDLAAMVSELGDLSFAGCADYKPTDQAASLCGFDKPTFTLTVDYSNDSGSKQTMTLVVGGVNSDKSGYYARLNDDTTIYNLSKDSVSGLLTIASSGFAS